jgi:hypothetical protein
MTRTRSTTAGLILLGLLSLTDVAGLLLTDGEHPPLVINVIGTVLGLASLVLVVLAWRGARMALGWLVGVRLLSAVSAVPAFVVPDVPAWAQLFAAAFIVADRAGLCAGATPATQQSPRAGLTAAMNSRSLWAPQQCRVGLTGPRCLGCAPR